MTAICKWAVYFRRYFIPNKDCIQQDKTRTLSKSAKIEEILLALCALNAVTHPLLLLFVSLFHLIIILIFHSRKGKDGLLYQFITLQFQLQWRRLLRSLSSFCKRASVFYEENMRIRGHVCWRFLFSSISFSFLSSFFLLLLLLLLLLRLLLHLLFLLFLLFPTDLCFNGRSSTPPGKTSPRLSSSIHLSPYTNDLKRHGTLGSMETKLSAI